MNWFKKIIVIVLCAVGLMSCGVKARIKRADKKYEIGEYYAAADIYRQVYGRLNNKKDRELKAHVAFRQGECYYILNNTRATNCFQNAIRLKYQDSIVYLHQAQALQYQGKYREAEKAYRSYLEGHPESYVAQSGVEACQNVAEWKKTPTRYKIRVMTELNGKRSSNFSPAYIGESADAVMFTSNRQQSGKGNKKNKRVSSVTGQQTFNLWTTRKNAAGKWEEIELPDGLYNENNNDNGKQGNDSTGGSKATGQKELGACCFTKDGRTIFFTFSCPVNGQDLGAKIYTASRASGEWGEAQEVKLFADSSITVGHPTLCPTGDTLYFVSDAPGGMGGKDIWMSVQDGDEWMPAENLGPTINTERDEMFPTMHPNGTLYFASNGHSGYGGLDIFYAERDTLQPKNDSVPAGWIVRNMGTPINSNYDDFGITFAGNSQNGLFSSNRSSQKKAPDLIYSFTLPEMVFAVEGTVTDANGEPLSDAMIRLVGNDGTNTKLSVRRDGTYKIKLRKDAHYAMLATARGHLNERATLATLDLKDSKTYTQNFSLAPISKPVQMDNVFYEFGKWTLTPESEAGLQGLVKLLNDNPNITIELSAHTDMKGDSVFNVNLSQKRAQAVCDYLIKQGIEAARLTPVGYGKQKPVTADQALHKQYKWMPVGQVLDEAYILTLNEERQEVCNTLNRRTEFKVLKTTYKLY